MLAPLVALDDEMPGQEALEWADGLDLLAERFEVCEAVEDAWLAGVEVAEVIEFADLGCNEQFVALAGADMRSAAVGIVEYEPFAGQFGDDST